MFRCFLRYRFTQEITKKQWRETFPLRFWSAYLDDLHFTTTFNGGVTEMIEYIRANPEPDLHFKGIGMLLYNMGKNKIYDQLVIDKIDKNLYKFKDQFSHRLAFGSFQGFIALSINNLYMQEFLEKEFLNTIDKLTLLEALDIAEACGQNKSLSREYLHSLITQYARPLIESNYRKLRNSPKKQISLFNSLIAAKYFDEDFFDRVMTDLVKQLKIRKLQTLLKIHSQLKQLNEEGDFPRNLDEQINILMERMRSREDFVWCYNFDEMRYFTMEEMRAKRENYTHPEQRSGRHLFQPAGLNEKYIEIRDKGEEGISKEEQEAREQKFIDEQLYDEFLLSRLKEKREAQIEKEEEVKEGEFNKMFEEKFKNMSPDQMPKLNDVFDNEESESSDDSDEESMQVTKKPKKKEFKKRKGRNRDKDAREFDREHGNKFENPNE